MKPAPKSDKSKNQPEKEAQPDKNQKPGKSPGKEPRWDSETSSYTDVTKIASTKSDFAMRAKSSENSPASLLLLSGPQDIIGQMWTLSNMVTSVGRSSRLNDIIIPEESLSKVHFQIIKEKGEFYIVDMKSTNKTHLNNNPLIPYQKILLENNSYIRTSHLIFKFLDKGNIETLSNQQMLDKSQIDSLTQAGNRHLLKIKGPEYFFSSKDLSLIVFDVDDFKTINDTYGHTAGDHVLKTLSKYILEIIRENDLFIRYGGDEFCIFTPNPIPIAKNMAERIKEKLKTTDLLFEDKEIPFDISIGIAEKLPEDTTWEHIYHRADQESYENKRKKKNSD